MNLVLAEQVKVYNISVFFYCVLGKVMHRAPFLFFFFLLELSLTHEDVVKLLV